MKAVIQTTDPTVIAFASAVLHEAGVPAEVFDGHMSITEGSIGIFPRRLMVADDRYGYARRLLTDAGLEGELRDP
ncbi:hypothetical protein CCR85_06865 [Rhodothalassium salexigens]|uniref:Putative signal transducing protein n=1 Tax=Rhodothalassium salexigens DSM 2132 TaxID=1188247 RepID=A0A4V2SND8_RHOSA|nr:DUF2007 domain-containing protein [Rhodothalassium salexigens]MBB4212626.1 hypothetical protein [Rhodothalassium salexigens DSM 2132]MBK1638760.1 hypothetical protein [Rhodothalassium salexigens DSM 2132]MBK5911213.1 hypothetical protein [Rhodothalassium salexigens]MBK5919902.1 hypothetical protein [Rhodothalassium salexigens]TCP30776.1 putative signal transducing protein [Rhodothalassium salexigens DSM 2132]